MIVCVFFNIAELICSLKSIEAAKIWNWKQKTLHKPKLRLAIKFSKDTSNYHPFSLKLKALLPYQESFGQLRSVQFPSEFFWEFPQRTSIFWRVQVIKFNLYFRYTVITEWTSSSHLKWVSVLGFKHYQYPWWTPCLSLLLTHHTTLLQLMRTWVGMHA